MTENPFRAHNHQRTAHRANSLATQQMENLCRRGWNHHLHIVLSTELQKTLQTRRGVLRPLPFKSVGQHHSQARKARPLVLTTGNKLINHHLSTIGKVTKLGFPNN